MQAKIERLVEKANQYAIWDIVTTEYFAIEIVGYTAKGNRIMRRVDRLLKAI